MLKLILFSVVAGIIGTGLGGVITAFLGRWSDKITCIFLAFAGGIMTSIVCFGLAPEALKISNVYIVMAGLIMGVVIILVLNRLVDRVTHSREDKLKLHSTPQELYHEDDLITPNSKRTLLQSGTLMLVAIGLHNIPEGMAIGAGGIHDIQLGMLLALMIALHNIPEGMAIAAPLLAGGLSRKRIIFLTMLSGTPTLIGAILGIAIGGLSDTAIALSLSVAGGAMLYVVFGEIIPQAVAMRRDRIATMVTLAGIILGLLLAAI